MVKGRTPPSSPDGADGRKYELPQPRNRPRLPSPRQAAGRRRLLGAAPSRFISIPAYPRPVTRIHPQAREGPQAGFESHADWNPQINLLPSNPLVCHQIGWPMVSAVLR